MSWLPTKGGITMRIVEFLAGNDGRWAKAVVGLLLIILGVALGGGGVRWVVAVIGLAPLTAAAFTFRQHRPRVRRRGVQTGRLSATGGSGAESTDNVKSQMRKIVARCLIVAGLGIVVFGFWMLILGSTAASIAASDDYSNGQAQMEQSVGMTLDSSQMASIADAAAQHQRSQMLTVVGTGALIVGGGSLIFGIVLARRPGEKIAATEPAILQSPPTGTPPPAADRKPCPQCGESISVLAHVCRFCQHDLDSDSV
jgi:hypothetical protein